MLEALRGLGYSPASALADIIDNSIAAQASRVDLQFSWRDAESYVAILDNGEGMNERELDRAMRLGEMNPLDQRTSHDLGRFGLGLQTASFSQSRRLTVASKKARMISCLRWDLDVLSASQDDGWYLLEGPSEGSEGFIAPVERFESGTLVLWEQLDRLVTPGFSEQNFFDLIDVADPDTGRRIVTHLPLLIIDDEADHASVDTGEQVFDSEGRPDEDHHLTAINRLIRRILHSFARSAYVGYTATPFANIFIHERGATQQEGPDLFPAAFIIHLAAPSNYIGPTRLFGLSANAEEDAGLPLLRPVTDHSTSDGRGSWMPQQHRNGHVPFYDGQDHLPPTLCEAIDAFLLACAIRRLRNQQNEHASMLVHVTRFNSIQHNVHRQVGEYIRQLRQRLTRGIGQEEVLRNIEQLWQRDFQQTTEVIRERYPDLIPALSFAWRDIVRVLPDTVSDIQVRMINGTAKDALDYAEHAGAGLKVIAIGGDKLARGLTLEGLCVSYFLRASRMYDTLMQMGRWFGYRPGYLDVCRLYTTSDLSDWFSHITEAGEELREEFDLMAASGATPRDYGLKVQSHPVLMVTSRLKMRTARNLMLSFSGQLLETVALYRDPGVLDRNLNAAKRLLENLGSPEGDPLRVRNGTRQQWQGYLWEDIPASDVVDFLTAYRTHPEAHKVNSTLLAEFIQSMVGVDDLTHWTIALIGGRDGRGLKLREGVAVKMLQRSAHGAFEDRYSIGRLMSPRDETIDLDEATWNAALTLTRSTWRADPARGQNSREPDAPNGPAVRKVRGFGAAGVPARPDKGVLFLYVLDPLRADAGFTAETSPVLAFAISFPGSSAGVKVEYTINNVLWEQEYGSSE